MLLLVLLVLYHLFDDHAFAKGFFHPDIQADTEQPEKAEE